MPCIRVSTNQKIDHATAQLLKTAFGDAIELIPGKSEKWLMCVFHQASDLWFQGTDEAAAYVEVAVFGKLDPVACENLTKAVTYIVNKTLGVAKERVYVKYSETHYWGWNGRNL